MNSQQLTAMLARVDDDPVLQNYIAQANARYILLNTREESGNFPRYTITDEKLELLAFYYLEMGCAFMENEDVSKAREPLEKGAAILEYVHASQANNSPYKSFYNIISALAYYVSFQYSKAFVLSHRVEESSVIGRIVKLFLRREFVPLTIEINQLLTDDAYTDGVNLTEDLDGRAGHRRIAEYTIADSIDSFIKFFFSGEATFLEYAKGRLLLLKEIVELSEEPELWWVVRLLILIQDGFSISSVWPVLRSHFPGEELGLEQYIRSLIYSQPRGIFELFVTQRESLEKVLDPANHGCVVSIPTSSGKTRIAEIAILNCLLQNPANKVLYIAPFRSLAFEVENSLEKILEGSGIPVSHLYGGSLYSSLDELSIEDSRVIISTPEKAKAILRSNADFIENIALIVLDEGHLLGLNSRFIKNEIFYEELRFFMEKNQGQFLLLSAVLPNPQDLALWLTDSSERVYQDSWRPSDERFGTLEWTGSQVNLLWESQDTERRSFNPRFISQIAIPKKPRAWKQRYFPENITDAVVATAYRLRNFGSVLIYVGRKESVLIVARAYGKQLDSNTIEWDYADDWAAFELACKEAYGDDNEWLSLARMGILCHHADLQPDVKLPLERLMRRNKPLVIVATSTLGQGVNLGVSSVIFASIRQGASAMSYRDFWNIAGRAGRAYVDSEGKVLVALDATNNETKDTVENWRRFRRRKEKISYDQSQIKKYFQKDKIGQARSGILALVSLLKKIAADSGTDFDLLIQLIAENQLSTHSDAAKTIEKAFDLIDDGLLALHAHHTTTTEIEWIEGFFSKSLACIQAQKVDEDNAADVVSIVRARITNIIGRVGADPVRWNAVVQSSLPLNSSLALDEVLPQIIAIVRAYLIEGRFLADKVNCLEQIEGYLSTLPVIEDDVPGLLTCENISSIRSAWISGTAFQQILSFKEAKEVLSKLYSYLLPWVLNGVSQKLRILDLEDEAKVVEELALLVETGLPTLSAVKVYQAGIRSRVAATELGGYFPDLPMQEIKSQLVNQSDFFKGLVSESTQQWIDLLVRSSATSKEAIRRIQPFYLVLEPTNKSLSAHTIRGRQFLLSDDWSIQVDVTDYEIDFSKVCDKPGITFTYSKSRNQWRMKNVNPYYKILD